MGFVSRQYIREKWNRAKYDMEEYLSINDETASDQISKEQVSKCISNIRQQFQSIINELEKCDL